MPSFLRQRMRWVLIFWMFVISAVAYLDRVNIAIAGKTIAEEFHLTNVQLGWVFSAFILGYALFQAPGGWLADRIGTRNVLLFGVIWWAVFTTLITFIQPGVSGLILIMISLRFLLGAGESVVYPASNRLVASWIPSTERGVANGFIFTGVGIGSGLTAPLIAYILQHYGWRWSFWVSALLGLGVGLIWYLLARDKPQQHPWVTKKELAHIEQGLPQKTSTSAAGKKLSWGEIFSNRQVLLITFSYFCYCYSTYIFFSWFFIYLSTVRGLNMRDSSYYTMLPFIAMAVGSLLGGWISDRLTRGHGRFVGRCVLAAIGIGLAAIFIALGTQVSSAGLATVILAGGAGAVYLSQSSFWSITADIGGESAGSVSGVMNMGGQFGGVVTSSLTPVIANHFGWTTSFLVAAGLCVLGALAWLLVDPEPKGATQPVPATTAH